MIILWTDAPFHYPGDGGWYIPYPGPSMSQTINAIKALDPPLVLGITSGGGGYSDLAAVCNGTGSVAPDCGVDCDGNGIIDVMSGQPLVCGISSSGHGVSEAIIALVEAASIVPENAPPVAICRDVTAACDYTGTAAVSVDDGSYDPDGGIVTLDQTPPGPYPIGTTVVTLTVTDDFGLVDECVAEVTVTANSKCVMLPGTWYSSWATNATGTIRAYIGNLPDGHVAGDVTPASIRLNGEVPIYNGVSRIRTSMTGFAGPVVEVAFSRQLAVQSLGSDPEPGTHTVLVAGEFAGGGMFAATVDVIFNNGTPKEDAVNDADGIGVPTVFSLSDPHPNPFNPITLVSFDLPIECPVSIVVFNIMGQKVRTLVDRIMPAGRHEVEWNATDDSGDRVASGVYLYRLHAGDFTQTKKMVLMK